MRYKYTQQEKDILALLEQGSMSSAEISHALDMSIVDVMSWIVSLRSKNKLCAEWVGDAQTFDVKYSLG